MEGSRFPIIFTVDDAYCSRAEGCTVSNKLLNYNQRNSRISHRINQKLLTELDRNREGRQIANNECRVYQRSFVHLDVHRHILRNQNLPRSVEYAVKTHALAVPIPVLPRMDDQRAFMVTRRVGNRPVPQENDE